MNLEVIIGLEIHAQLSTKSKLFCGCDNDAFGAPPNTRTCPVCMGFPGTLPALNQAAVTKATEASLALGCDIQSFAKFDRKNYFYPDLPFGYQISQYDQPLALKGQVEYELEDSEEIQSTRIHRVHIENDAGKLSHEVGGTLLDFNRAGTPLIEIVTEPDLRSPEQAQSFAKEVQNLLRWAQASDADMEKGMMRFDASISLRPVGEDKLYPRTEIKNLNSFTSLHKALRYEISRQTKLWEKDDAPTGETTVGWLDDEERTQLLREKESAHDYRYFPEPDLPPLELEKAFVEELSKVIATTPLAKRHWFRENWKLSIDESRALVGDRLRCEFVEAAVNQETSLARPIVNLFLSVVLAESDWHQTKLTPENLHQTTKLFKENKLSSTGAKEVLQITMNTGESPDKIMKSQGLEQVSDNSTLETWADEILAANESVVADILGGKDQAIGFLVGQVMKRSSGSANPAQVKEILIARIKAKG